MSSSQSRLDGTPLFRPCVVWRGPNTNTDQQGWMSRRWKQLLIVIAVALCDLGSPAAAAIHKCTDMDGKVSFSDTPCPTGSKTEKTISRTIHRRPRGIGRLDPTHARRLIHPHFTISGSPQTAPRKNPRHPPPTDNGSKRNWMRPGARRYLERSAHGLASHGWSDRAHSTQSPESFFPLRAKVTPAPEMVVTTRQPGRTGLSIRAPGSSFRCTDTAICD